MGVPGPTRRRIAVRLSVTEQCDLRCRYCRPATGACRTRGAPTACDAELLQLVERLRAVHDVYKVRLTGGEPLVHGGLPGLVGGLRARLPDATLGLTTNGGRLAGAAGALRRAGLDSVNVSLDTLDPAKFRALTRGGRLAATLAGVQAACAAGFTEAKLNAVLLRSVNGAALPGLVRFAAAQRCEIRFIELMPFGEGAHGHAGEFLSAAEALGVLAGAFTYGGRLPPSRTAQRHAFRVAGRPVTVGFIPTMTEPFCGACDRYRLDRRGRLFSCLRDAVGRDLLSPLRAGDEAELRRRITGGVDGKTWPAGAWPTRSMVAVGG